MIKTTSFQYLPEHNRIEITQGHIVRFEPQNHGIFGIDLEVLKFAGSGVIETHVSGKKEAHIILPSDESKKDAANEMLAFYLDPHNRHDKLFFEYNATAGGMGEIHVGPTIDQRIGLLAHDCDVTRKLADAFRIAGDGTYRMVRGGGYIIKAREPARRDAANALVPTDMKPKFGRV